MRYENQSSFFYSSFRFTTLFFSCFFVLPLHLCVKDVRNFMVPKRSLSISKYPSFNISCGTYSSVRFWFQISIECPGSKFEIYCLILSMPYRSLKATIKYTTQISYISNVLIFVSTSVVRISSEIFSLSSMHRLCSYVSVLLLIIIKVRRERHLIWSGCIWTAIIFLFTQNWLKAEETSLLETFFLIFSIFQTSFLLSGERLKFPIFECFLICVSFTPQLLL